MRLSTIAAIGVLTIATAALAQSMRTPAERKNAPANAGNAAASAADPMGNDAMGAAPANGTAAPPDAKTEPATPQR